MHTDDGSLWMVETTGLLLSHVVLDSMTYHYQLEDNDGKVCRKEWDATPRFYIINPSNDYFFQDIWRDLSVTRYLYPLSKRKKFRLDDIPQFNRSIIFRVSAPQVGDDQTVALLGSEPTLGVWKVMRYLPLHYIGDGDWMLSINAYALELPFEFKYVVVDNKTHDVVEWESGDNRKVEVSHLGDHEQLVIFGGNVRTKCKLSFHEELLDEEHTLEHEIRELYI